MARRRSSASWSRPVRPRRQPTPAPRSRRRPGTGEGQGGCSWRMGRGIGAGRRARPRTYPCGQARSDQAISPPLGHTRDGMEATKRRAAARRRGPVLRGRGGQAERVRHALEPLVPGAGLLALTLFVGFEAGGYFPGTSGLAAALVALALIVYTTRSSRPFEGLSVGLV